VVLIGRVPGREEDHVVAVAKRHEFQTVGTAQRSPRRAFGVSHPGKMTGKRCWHAASPTWRANCRCSDPGGPKPTSECCVSLTWMVM
jgi:hypothetical protein